MLTKDIAYGLIDKVVAASRFDVVVTIDFQDLSLTRFANSEIHQNMATADTKIAITVFDGEKMATVATNVMDEGAVLSALNSAELMLPLLQPSGMAFEQLSAMDPIEREGYDLAFDTLWGIEERAGAIADAVKSLEEGYIASGAFEVKHSAMAWGNGRGVRRFDSGSQAHLEVMITHADGASGYSDILVKNAQSLDFGKAFNHAFNKAQAGRDAVVLEPGTYTVVLEPQAVNELLNFIGYLGANAKFYQEGLSPFNGKLGQQVAVPALSISDDATLDKQIGTPFDAEGYPRQNLNIIENGIFKDLAYDTPTAKKDGMQTTGHSTGYRGDGGIPLNLVMARGTKSLEEMIASVDRGLLVSRFHYMNVVDPTTGMMTALTRDGLFTIEGGKITSSVKNLRFTDAIPRILSHIVAIGNYQEVLPSFYGSNLVCALQVEDFKFTGGTSL